jgi:hypothetical protein
VVVVVRLRPDGSRVEEVMRLPGSTAYVVVVTPWFVVREARLPAAS